jgi:hypothetical protein
VESFVQAAFARELGEAEREPRVRNDLRTVVLEARVAEPRVQRVVGARADAVAAVQVGQRDAFRRILGMQVEREPENLGVELAPCLLGRLLAEPAERSDVVAPDDDRVLGHFTEMYGFGRGG